MSVMTSHIDQLFFATFPDREAAGRIAALASDLKRRHRLRGALLQPERLHVSICPVPLPFVLPPSAAAKLKEAAESVAMPRFTVMFDRVMSFNGRRGHRPLVLGRGEGTAGLEFLHDAVRRAMSSAGLHHIRPKDFHPHVTLLYGDHDLPEQDVEQISWTVDKLTLVHSLQGLTIYRRLGEWPLRGRIPPMPRAAAVNPSPAADHRRENKKRHD